MAARERRGATGVHAGTVSGQAVGAGVADNVDREMNFATVTHNDWAHLLRSILIPLFGPMENWSPEIGNVVYDISKMLVEYYRFGERKT